MKKNNRMLERIFDKGREKERVLQVETSRICPNTAQPRQDFDSDAIVKLADSIRQYGILQPLTVRKIESESEYAYELIASERRLRASKMLGLATVPCILVDANDEVSAELALVENMLRENLSVAESVSA
jgi:ParB family chromosome partitioning protein